MFIALGFSVARNQLFAQSHLPAVPAWKGRSEELIVKPKTPGITPFERSNGLESATEEQLTMWFDTLMQRDKRITRHALCTTAQNRTVWMYAFSTQALGADAFNQPQQIGGHWMVFQAGIHSGEIDGLDAGMMLYRDIVAGKLDLVNQGLNLLFIPILNLDGHHRSSEHNRINQRGPAIQGWRSNALNQNLNRDYSKLESNEIAGIVKLISRLKPALYLDIHVTDGADYQYDITYGSMGSHAYSPNISAWLHDSMKPFVDKQLSNFGHIPGPLIFLKNEKKPVEGNMAYTFSARFSHAYGDLVHIPTVLVENHSLKPFRQRVLGTRVLLQAMAEAVLRDKENLTKAIEKDRNQRNKTLTLSWDFPKLAKDSMVFKGFKPEYRFSEAAGAEVITWNAEPINENIPLLVQNEAKFIVEKPRAYLVPETRKDIQLKLQHHGISGITLKMDSLIEVNRYKMMDIEFSGKQTNQGRTRFQGKIEDFTQLVLFRAGTVFYSTDQPLGDLLVVLLEPESSESFFQWGFFTEMIERTEYFETYAMAPIADEMMRSNPELKMQFEKELETNAALKDDPEARLRWWYDRSVYADKNWKIYPVSRIE